MSNLIDDRADVGSSEDEDFDEETGEAIEKQRNGATRDFQDSSEEDDEDEDEERKIREGFIVDEDEDEEDDIRQARHREKRKRRREEREEALDEEDLDLIGEANPDFERRTSSQPKFKRLKQGHREDRLAGAGSRVQDIFSDEEDEVMEDQYGGYRGRDAINDEFADFIEQDDLGDDALEDEREVARPGKRLAGAFANLDISSLDEAALEDYRAAFGDGNEYEWALDMEQEAEIDEQEQNKELQLTDVFEPSVLAEKLLTEEDNVIRNADIPERLQLARRTFKVVELSEKEAAERTQEEITWVTNLIAAEKRVDSYRMEYFQKAITKVLEFLNVDNYEVPFIKQYRKDHLIYPVRIPNPDRRPGASEFVVKEERLLSDTELWDVFDADIKFRGLMERRDAVQRASEGLKRELDVRDSIIDEMLPTALNVNEVQDLQEYINFQYASELKDIAVSMPEMNGTQKRARGTKSVWERLRSSRVYTFVKTFGITPDALAQDLKHGVKRTFSDDPTERPVELADSLLDPPTYSTGEQVLRAARAMIIEEFTMSPRLRKYIRDIIFKDGVYDCIRTEKGARQITEDHRYYDFKYLRNQPIRRAGQDAEVFLRMLKAESEGLVNVTFRVPAFKDMQRKFRSFILSDNLSEVAEAWNDLRQEVVDEALQRLVRLVSRGVKETLKSGCEDKVAKACREKLKGKLDQAPFRPAGLGPGSKPSVLALSAGNGVPGRDAICWCFVEHSDGRALENGKFTEFRLRNEKTHKGDSEDVETFLELVKRRNPEVIAISGFSIEARRLLKDIETLVEREGLTVLEAKSDETHPLPVTMVLDECARLYYTTARAVEDNPGFPPLTRYCFGLARYLQNPTLEYVALGKNITSISLHPSQELIPREKLNKYLEMAFVDVVNMTGLMLNQCCDDQGYYGLQLQYVSGLGPRKVASIWKAASHNDGFASRSELAGDPERELMQAVSAKIFENCAGFLFPDEDVDSGDNDTDPLDNTRIHPEDYELARKICADALDMDEEDIADEVKNYGPSACVRKLFADEKQDAVNDLSLEEYAANILKLNNLKKRATLELIRNELLEPHEEVRLEFAGIKSDELFTMLTGETAESLQEGMIVPVKIRRFFPDHIEVKLDCGLDGHISESEYPEGVGGNGIEPRQYYSINQTVQAKLLYLQRKIFTCQLSVRARALQEPFKRTIEHTQSEWDYQQEDQDKRNAQKEKDESTGRAQRVIKHPLFRPFNYSQAEEYLGSQPRGAVVIRPSSRGLDHLNVTWKVADGIYQHIDVLELNKDNEFALGKTLRIGNVTYSDLDELIVTHIQGMAKKVDEMMHDERFQNLSRNQAEDWLNTYTEANPKRSMYAFCTNPKFPGYFWLLIKEGLHAPLRTMNVKVIPNGFKLNESNYPDMRSLRNGLKLQLEAERKKALQQKGIPGRL